MKINGTGGVDPIKAYKVQLKNTEKIDDQNKTEGEQNQSDRLEISAEAKKIQSYKEVLAGISSVREDLVAALKKQVQEGTYLPDSRKIAAGIALERLTDNMRNQD